MPDGAYGWTGVDSSRSRNIYQVEKSHVFTGTRTYIDGGTHGQEDGKVDHIKVWSWIGKYELDRTTDYETHKEAFDEADDILVETKERIKKEFK